MNIDEECFRRARFPRFMGASGVCKDICVDEIPVQDGIPDGLLHREGRRGPQGPDCEEDQVLCEGFTH